MVDAEEPLAALFMLLARVEGGPEAICLENDGAGADALMHLAVDGPEAAQEFALDALFQAATRHPKCASFLRKQRIRHTLHSAQLLTDGSPSVKTKVGGPCLFLLQLNVCTLHVLGLVVARHTRF